MKILVIRFSSIGDIVLTTPVIRCLSQQTHAEIHYLVKPEYEQVIKANPYLAKIHLLQSNLAETIRELQSEGFQQIIDLHHNLRSARIKKALAEVPSSSFYKMNVEKWLLVNFGINRLQNRHIVDRYLDTVSHLGVENDNQGLDYFIPDGQEVDVTQLPNTHQAGYVAYAIGGNHMYKKLPEEKIIEIAKSLNQPLVLLGGKEDAPAAERIAAAVGERVYNACGTYSLNQSASLVKQAKVVIAHDTGLMHIAAAFKKPIVSIWGATTPSLGMYPYLPGKGSTAIEPKGGSRRPYSKLGNYKWYKGPFTGFNHLSSEEIVAAVNSCWPK